MTDLETLRALSAPTRAAAQVAMGWREVVAEAQKTLEAAGPDEGAARAAQVAGVLGEALDISANAQWGRDRHRVAVVGAVKVLMGLRAVPAAELEQSLDGLRAWLYR